MLIDGNGCSYQNTSVQLLREAAAAFARKLCVEELYVVQLQSLEAYVACRPISLDKCPGVRPI